MTTGYSRTRGHQTAQGTSTTVIRARADASAKTRARTNVKVRATRETRVIINATGEMRELENYWRQVGPLALDEEWTGCVEVIIIEDDADMAATVPVIGTPPPASAAVERGPKEMSG